MEIDKLSRRQFLGGAAAVVGAAVLPAIMNVTPAMATPTTGFSPTGIPAVTSSWTPLDATAAARLGYDIYKGKFNSGIAPQYG